MTERQQGFTTRALEVAKHAEAVTQRPLSPPLYQSATFAFDDMDEFAAVARAKTSGGYLYSRWANPTVDALARAVASLEGAEAGACFSSGMAAIYGTLLSLLRAGDHVVSASQLYGGTHGLFNTALARAGVGVTRVDVADHDAVVAAFTDETRVLYAETIGNPLLTVADIDALAAVAHARGVLFVVDGTFTPPYLLRALEHGADLVAHSATKYLAGHSDVTAGVVVGDAARIDQIRHLSIDTGGMLAPFEAWLCARGLQTLALRMERICSNALGLARFLEKHPGVRAVLYPGLESHPQHELAARLLGGRFGGMVAFDVGDLERGRAFLTKVRVAKPAASLGGTRTLVVHPASITHTQLSAEERLAAGITDGMIRLSVGIEDLDDLTADFDAALS